MKLRRFNADGVAAFRAYIATLKTDKTLPPPAGLLTDPARTEVVQPETDCPDATFANRLEAAQHLDKVLTAAGLADAFEDVGLWSWLSLRFFDQLRPMGRGVPLAQLGVDEARFIPTNSYEDRHRHLLRHPLQAYLAVGRQAQHGMCFLAQPVHRPGDIVEQFGSRQLYLRNPDLLATLSALVVDPAAQKIRANAASRARRLHDVLQQFDCTFDLGFIVKDALIAILPQEFRQLRAARSAPAPPKMQEVAPT